MSVIISQKMSVEEIMLVLEKLPAGKTFKSAKHCGILKLTINPLVFQKQLRDEWQ